jgi:hypothetical protein
VTQAREPLSFQTRISIFAVIVLLVFGISKCGGTPTLNKVDQYVVEACDISWGAEGDDKGKWIAPAMENEAEPWSPWTSPISELTKIRDGWQRRIVPGTAAAQIDPAFRPLADAIKGMLEGARVESQLFRPSSNIQFTIRNLAH